MNKTTERIGLAGAAFGVGFGSSLEDTNTWAIAVTVGIYQGLKYNGSLKNGIVAGVSTLAVLASAEGIRTLILNKALIAKGIKE